MKEEYSLVGRMKLKSYLLKKEDRWRLRNKNENKNSDKNKDNKCN